VALTKLAAIIVLLLVSSGCFTGRVSDRIEEIQPLDREFLRERRIGVCRFVVGLYLGRVQKYGREYERYQFPRVLAGSDDRMLQVLIPIGDRERNAKAIISESSRNDEVKAYAGLVYSWITQPPIHTFRTDPHTVDSYAESHGLDRLRDDSNTQHVVFVSLGFPYFVLFLSEKPESGEPEWDYRLCHLELNWNVRSRVEYYLMHGVYVGSVLPDIVTLPFQILGWGRCG